MTRKILRIETVIDRCADCTYFREPNQYSNHPYCASPGYKPILDPDDIAPHCFLQDADDPDMEVL